MVFGLGRQINGTRHHLLGMIGHWRVVKIKSFQVLDRSSLVRFRRISKVRTSTIAKRVLTLTTVGNWQKSENSIVLRQ